MVTLYTPIAWLKFYLLFRLLHSVLIRVQVIGGECGPRLRPPGGVLLQGQMQQGRRFGVSMHFLQFRVRIKLQLSQYLSEKVTKTRCLDCFTSSKQFFQSLGSSWYPIFPFTFMANSNEPRKFFRQQVDRENQVTHEQIQSQYSAA